MTTTFSMGELVTGVGSPEPLGATVHDNGVNFAVHSGAPRVSLLLFANASDLEPAYTVPMTETNGVYHIFVEKLSAGALYLYSADGDYNPLAGDRYNSGVQLIDPEARMVTGATNWVAPVAYDNSNPHDPDRELKKGKGTTAVTPKCVVVGPDNFDWQGDTAPNTPLVETIVYEVSVKGFTGHKSANVKFRGTFKGFIEKIPHLKRLGITAVELMPIMAWYRKTPFRNPLTGEELENVWAYNTIALGAPDEELATASGAQCYEFKLLVRELHKAGIEVYLDIVPNHTPEGTELGPTISLRGLDNKSYMLLLPGEFRKYANFSGCGNTMSCNHPATRKLILNVLRHWVREYHVDGFRFDLAAVLGINCDLSVTPDAPVLKEIACDPVLRNVKLIAEPWSVGAYLMGQFRAPWSEWCGRFRDTVRAFVRGEAGQVSQLATSVCGSQDLFGPGNNRRIAFNLVDAHDGFPIWDLTAYDEKHNQANGEGNQDGESHNRSWNCGYEGDVANAPLSEDEKRRIDALRRKQVKNFFTLLLVSRGVPMFVYGDEMGRTNGGNNNPWNQLLLNLLDWALLEENPDLFRYVCMLIAFRKKHFLGGRGHDPVFRSVTWHGVKPFQPDWSEWSRLLIGELGQFEGEGVDKDNAVYVAANGYWEQITVQLPEGNWVRIADTSLASGEDIVEDDVATAVGGEYVLQPRSTVVLMRV